jgi:hypothetical protein
MTLHRKTLVVLAALLLATTSVSQTVFKWTDESGVVHYGDSVPAGVESFERVGITSASPPATGAPAPAVTEPAPEAPAGSAPVATPQAASALSVEELDRLCENAREAAIAPLRTAAIDECKAEPRSDPAYCERFYADFGDGGRAESGAYRPRQFDDLPECVQAQQERATSDRR